MDSIPAALDSVQQQLASHQQASEAFFNDIERLAAHASTYLSEFGKLANEADRQKLRTAALKLRLNQLAKDRRSREAAAAAIVDAKQRELARLLQEEQLLQQRGGSAQTAGGGAPATTAAHAPGSTAT